MRNALEWIEQRTGYRGVLHALLLLNFPVDRAARWRYVWGGSLALMFLVEVVTGTLLMTVYSPSEASAWGSVQYLERFVAWGWFVRGVHHYTAHMMVVVLFAHLLIVLVTAGYRAPKEFTYWSGLVLAAIVLALAISGNPLPWDQKGYWSYQIETGIAGTMPIIGPSLRTLVVGGAEFGNLTLTRLYTLHVVVLPVLASLLLVMHVALMRREKLKFQLTIRDYGPDAGRGMEPYWPYQSTRNLAMFAVLMGLVVVQVVAYPTLKDRHIASASIEWERDVPVGEITLEAPADPDMAYVARPEWYVRFLYELRHRVPKELEVLVTGLLPLVIVSVLFLVPFVENLLGRRLGRAVIAGVAVAGLTGMYWVTFDGISRDRHDPEFQAARRRALDYAGRAIWLAGRNGIPPEGPVTLLHSDPKAKGPLLFAAHCATCHRWNGHDGTGTVVMETVDGKRVAAIPTAADLHGFGSRKWIAEFLSHPQDKRFFGHLDRLKGGSEIKDGEMASWAEDNIAPNGPLTPHHVDALAALVAREAQRRDESPADEELVKLGVALFSGAELHADAGQPLEFEGACSQCHELKAGDPSNAGSGSAPNLNGYASKRWLIDFIRNPADDRFYPDNNLMPAFDETQLTDRDLQLLIDWMRGEWLRGEWLRGE